MARAAYYYAELYGTRPSGREISSLPVRLKALTQGDALSEAWSRLGGNGAIGDPVQAILVYRGPPTLVNIVARRRLDATAWET